MKTLIRPAGLFVRTPFEIKTAGAGTAGPPARAAKKVQHVSVGFEIKADSVDDAARTFQGLASTWQLDLGNDQIHIGAFKRTLDHWKTSGRVIPLIDLHNSDSIKRVVGKLIAAEETADGLLCTFELLEDGDPDADAAWKRIKGRFITGLSIGYRAIRWEMEQPEGTTSWWDQIRHLQEVELIEVSLVIWGMNEGALIDAGSVKGLFAALLGGNAVEEVRAQFLALDAGQKQQIRALLEDEPTPDPAPNEGDTPPPTAEPKGLAPEDPRRIALEAVLRDLTLRSLAA